VKKVHEPPSQPRPWHGDTFHHLVFPATLGSTNSKVSVQASLGIRCDPISKVTNAKRADGVNSAPPPTHKHTYIHTDVLSLLDLEDSMTSFLNLVWKNPKIKSESD
jgi:hypothetical protein